jgi:hypothetical protein
VVVLAIVYCAFRYARPELSALLWHTPHGFHAEINGIKVPVPFSYEADSNGIGSLTLMKTEGMLQPGAGFIMVSFFPRLSPEAEQRVEELMAKKGGMTKTRVGERTVTFAGRSGTCIEFTQKIGDRLADEMLRKLDLRAIDCRFGDVNVKFGGSANLKDDFYGIIQSAQQIGRKN